MDFHRFSRRDLQKLCKMNKIPANLTNVAMADALGALQQVEGLDEFFNPVESDKTEQFLDEKLIGTPQIQRTACKTSTRRKPVREEPESSKVSTRLRRGTRAGNAEGNDQENKDLNVPATPAMPNKTRAPAMSTRRKKETHTKEDGKIDVPKTPAAPPSTRFRGAGRSVSSKLETTVGSAIQRTRRSMRLLEKSLTGMCLMDTEEMDTEHVKNDEVSVEMTYVSQQIQDSPESEMAASLQTSSTVDSESSNDVESTSQEKNNGYECQPQEPQAEVQLAGMGLLNTGDAEHVKTYEISEEITTVSLQNQGSAKTEMGTSVEISSAVNSENSHAVKGTSQEKNNGCENQPQESQSELQLGSESGASLQDSFQEVNCNYYSEDYTNPELGVCSEILNDLGEVLECCDESEEFSNPIEKEVKLNDESINGGAAVFFEVENSIDFSNPEDDKPFSDAIQDVSVGTTDDASPDVTDQEIAGLLAVSSPNSDSVSPKGLIEFHTENQDEENEQWNLVDNDEMLHPDGRSPAKLEVGTYPLLVDSLSNSEESSEVMEKISFVSENSVDDQPGDVEVKMGHNSEHSEASEEPETSVLLCELEDPKVYSANSVADLKSGDIEEVEMYSLEVDSENFQAERAVVEESGALVKDDVIPEEIAFPKQEFQYSTDENEYEIMKHCNNPSDEGFLSSVDEVTLSTTLPSNCEQKISDVPIQSVSVNQPKDLFPCPVQSESDETANANEVQTAQNTCIQEGDQGKILKMKENLNTDALNVKSMRELKKMFKTLSLDAKANMKSNNGAKPEVERKRTALQALPENRMARSEAETDA